MKNLNLLEIGLKKYMTLAAESWIMIAPVLHCPDRLPTKQVVQTSNLVSGKGLPTKQVAQTSNLIGGKGPPIKQEVQTST